MFVPMTVLLTEACNRLNDAPTLDSVHRYSKIVAMLASNLQAPEDDFYDTGTPLEVVVVPNLCTDTRVALRGTLWGHHDRCTDAGTVVRWQAEAVPIFGFPGYRVSVRFLDTGWAASPAWESHVMALLRTYLADALCLEMDPAKCDMGDVLF